MWEFFHSKYIEFTDKHIVSVNVSPSHPLRLDTTTWKLIRKKHKAWDKYKVTKQQLDFPAFVKIRNSTTSAIRIESVYEHNLAFDIKNNPKKFVHMFTIPFN